MIIILSIILFASIAILLLVDALVAIGVFLLIFGLGVPEKLGRDGGRDSKRAELTELDVIVLQSLSQNKSQDEIARSTGVSPIVLSEKCAALMAAGYISGTYLTEKGFDALRNARPKA